MSREGMPDLPASKYPAVRLGLRGREEVAYTGDQLLAYARAYAVREVAKEREARQSAQAELERCKAEIARLGLERMRAVRQAQEACAGICDGIAEEAGCTDAERAADACAIAIRIRLHPNGLAAKAVR